jgi:hypothetical protein
LNTDETQISIDLNGGLNKNSRMAIDSDLIRSLSDKSNQELIGILETPADWRPEIVEFARSELGRRSISAAQIDQNLTDKAKKKAEELQKKSTDPLSFWETASTVLYGGGLGLLGLLFVWPQTSRFEAEGYLLKSKKSWRIYWIAFGVRMAAVLLLIAFIIFVR